MACISDTRPCGPTGPSSGSAPPFGRASFGITASVPSRNRCRPWPCVRLSRTRTTTVAPLRPVPDRSVDGGPNPTIRVGYAGAGQDRDGSRVHLQLARRRRSPTLALRHRHGYPSATLAEPIPSGSTGASRLCQGCSHPPRHLPGRAALNFTALLRQDDDEGLPPPFELSAPHGARGSRLKDVHEGDAFGPACRP